MHEFYRFDFLDTVSRQLIERLDGLRMTLLDERALEAFRRDVSAAGHDIQGIYVLYLGQEPVYLGKADDVPERLSQHRRKILGRQGIDASEVSYKAILLDGSMGTAANESLLIRLFSKSHTGLWNGKGFGPKDPGKERDTTRPGHFDSTHPIRYDFPLESLFESVANGIAEERPLYATGLSRRLYRDGCSVAELFRQMKAALPFVFRYEYSEVMEGARVDLMGSTLEARDLLERSVLALPDTWTGAVLSFGIVVYSGIRSYPHAQRDPVTGMPLVFTNSANSSRKVP